MAVKRGGPSLQLRDVFYPHCLQRVHWTACVYVERLGLTAHLLRVRVELPHPNAVAPMNPMSSPRTTVSRMSVGGDEMKTTSRPGHHPGEKGRKSDQHARTDNMRGFDLSHASLSLADVAALQETLGCMHTITTIS